MEKSEKMTLQTRLGEQAIDSGRIITFPRGLMGFENLHLFTLLRIRQGSPFLLLQSAEDSSLGLLVTDPYTFLTNYPVRVDDAEQHLLQIEKVSDVSVLVTVSIPSGKPELTTLNLTGPILVNHKRLLGLQVPQTNPAIPPRICIHRREK